jgi:mono/diheme cytochrome c family protein
MDRRCWNRAAAHFSEVIKIREVTMSNLWSSRSNGLKQRIDGKIALAVALFALLAFTLGAPVVFAQAHKSPADAGKNGSDVARGKYLVEDVAMCGQCHTPRDSSGNLDRSHWLQGAPIRWVPADGPTTNWPLTAPRIGGNPPASDADMVKLLTTGTWTTGKPLRFPMMPFRMSEADAKAVVAYLKSLTPQN